jgi:tRNA 2-selenouridine synthase
VAARAAYLVQAYGDMVADGARLVRVIERLRPLHAAERIETWQAMAGAGAFVDLAAGLMQHHYDPRYGKHRARQEARFVEIEAAGLGPDDLTRLADQVAEAVRAAI